MKTTTKKNATVKLLQDRPNGKLIHDEIALAAYCIWEQEGSPQGREVDNWLRAESLLRQAGKPAAVQA